MNKQLETQRRRMRFLRFSAFALVLALAISLAASPTRHAGAASTGFANPAAQAADTGGDGDGFETNPQDAFSDSNGEAEDRDSGTNTTVSCSNTGKDRHRFYNYGFSVPAGSTINGIQVRVDARLDAAGGYICAELSSDGGLTWTASKQTAGLTSSFTTNDIGGAADTWGRTWSAADFSNANFRLRLTSVANNTSARFRLDWVSAQVHYSEPGSDVTGPSTSNVAAVDAGGGSVTLTATVNDSVSGGANIAGAEYFVDSIGVSGAGAPMAAADGAFSSPVENVTATVAVGGLPVGDHTLYVHGRDAAGNWGASGLVVVAVVSGGTSAVQATVQLVAGTLSVSAQPVNFPTVALNGSDQTVEATPAAWRAIDGRGTGAGWTVTITSTDFTAAQGSISAPNHKIRLLPANITTVSGGAPPVSLVSSYQALSSITPLKLLSAGTGTGMGTFDLTPEFSLLVPASTAPGQYTASIVVSVNTGP